MTTFKTIIPCGENGPYIGESREYTPDAKTRMEKNGDIVQIVSHDEPTIALYYEDGATDRLGTLFYDTHRNAIAAMFQKFPGSQLENPRGPGSFFIRNGAVCAFVLTHGSK